MGDRKQTQEEVSFGMNKYFGSHVLPTKVTGKTRTVVRRTPNTQCEDETLLLVKSGEGEIIINHESFPLEKGVFICMGPFHNYVIYPAKEQKIELMEVHMNSGAYLYLLSCPYLKISKMLVPQPPAVALLAKEELEEAVELMERIQSIQGQEKYHTYKLSFLLTMQLFGILTGKYTEKIKTGEDKAEKPSRTGKKESTVDH